MGERLPVVSGEQAAQAFCRLGYVLVPGRGKGSHLVVHQPDSGRILTIPRHRELRRGTLRALIRLAGLSVTEFRALLG